MVESERIPATEDTNIEHSIERRFYLSSVYIDIDELLSIIQNHWKIELMHWCLDVTFYGNYTLMYHKTQLQIINLFKKSVLTLLDKFNAK